jgi:hypothetical protein
MKNLKEKVIAGGFMTTFVVVMMFVFGVFSFDRVEAASVFGGTCKTATATTSVNFMRAGAATTTLTCFTGSDAMLTANLRMQFTSTTTPSTLSWKYEYSNDGVEWYGDTYVDGLVNATSTGVSNLTKNNSYTWNFASSTTACDGSDVVATRTRLCKSVFAPTPSKFIRVIFYMEQGSGNGAIWAELTPKGDI